ncbi:MAG: DNA-binding protein, partial [Mycobacteriaceae bacterium]
MTEQSSPPAASEPPGAEADLDIASARPEVRLREPLSYRVKRRLLGPPLTNDQLGDERLSKKVALGVLAPDCISSSAYGTE